MTKMDPVNELETGQALSPPFDAEPGTESLSEGRKADASGVAGDPFAKILSSSLDESQAIHRHCPQFPPE